MRVEWHTVGGICKRVYQEMEESRSSRFNGLVNIGIDETSYKKGHKYMTVVINHDKSSVIWCAPGYGKDVLSQFFELLSEEQRASIRCVSADGARWIASCVEEYCPNAQRCIDPFHVVSWATDAFDQVRREAWAEAHQQAKNQQKRDQAFHKQPLSETGNQLKCSRISVRIQSDKCEFIKKSCPKIGVTTLYLGGNSACFPVKTPTGAEQPLLEPVLSAGETNLPNFCPVTRWTFCNSLL